MNTELGYTLDGRPFPVYQGELLSWCISLTMADEEQGYPKARTVIRALRQYRPEQLEQERKEMLKASFNGIFGHNAKKCLTLIEEELAKVETGE